MKRYKFDVMLAHLLTQATNHKSCNGSRLSRRAQESAGSRMARWNRPGHRSRSAPTHETQPAILRPNVVQQLAVAMRAREDKTMLRGRMRVSMNL